MIKELDEKGIGRPSTYAAIISKILDREYVAQNESRRLAPTDLGILVTDLLVESFPDILNVEFTASMEDELDKIEDGKEKWTKAMKRFYTPFAIDLKKAEKEMRDVKRQEVPTDIDCEKCGNTMVIKWGRNGEFIACPQYPECKNTKNFKRADKGEIEIAAKEEVDRGLREVRRSQCCCASASSASFSAAAAIPSAKIFSRCKSRWTSASNAPSARKATSKSANRAGARCSTAATNIPNANSPRGTSRCRRLVPTAAVRFSSRK